MPHSNIFLNLFYDKAKHYIDKNVKDFEIAQTLHNAMADANMTVEEKLQLLQLQNMIDTEYYQKKTKGYLKFFYVLSLISLIASAAVALLFLLEAM